MELNEQQKKAVEHKGSPLLIVAGPGSGKTTVITERVINLVKSGINPSEILCLTFTNKAAENMQQKLQNNEIADVETSTFHAFAQSILRDNILESGINIGGGTLRRSSQLVWALKNIDSFDFQHVKIKNNAEDVIRSIIDGIRTFKDELISAEELKKYLDEKLKEELSEEAGEFVQRLKDLHRVYEKYQEFWDKKPVIDFNDMIVECVKLLSQRDDVRKRVQKKYKHILVDEFQDNNYAQLEIVKLVSDGVNVTAVGDDDQSIFRFQGAYMKNFSDFQKNFPNTAIINLDQNYRSTQNIVKLANSLVESIPERQKKKLFSENKKGNKIVVAECTDEGSEVEFVVKTIKELLGKPITREDGSEGIVTYDDFAILARSRISGTKFVKALRSHGLPADFIGAGNLFTSSVIKDLMAYLKIANSPVTSGRELTRLMSRHGITDYNIAKINSHAEEIADKDNPGVDFVLKSLQEISKQEISQKKEIEGFIEILNQVMELSKYTPSVIIYKILMNISGLYKNAIASNSGIDKINRILLQQVYDYALEYETVYPEESLEDFISYLQYLFRFDPEMPEDLSLDDSILVTTIHDSKGKEFQVVFVVDVVKDKLPLRPKTKKFYVPKDLAKGLVRSEDEKILHKLDEKRLLYVAMTRAKSHLYITFARDYEARKVIAENSEFLVELDFEKNPLIECVKYNGSENVHFEDEERLEQVKHQYQKNATLAINQMNLNSAIQRIVDLAKIQYFQQKNTLDGFNLKKVLDVEPENNHVESELYQEHVPLIKKENFRLSASKIETFDQCPLKFKFQYVLNTPKPGRTWLDFGSAIHSVAENLTKLEKEGKESTEELANEILQKYWNPAAYRNQRTKEKEDKELSKEMIRSYLDWVENNPNSAVDVEAYFRIEINDCVVSGKIDRVEKTPDGEYEVVDFKTGSVQESKNTIKDNVQMNMYALGVEKLYKKYPKKASLFYIKHDRVVPYIIEPEKIEEFKKTLSDKIDSIFSEKFEAKPEYQKCKMCDYREICDEKDKKSSA